MTTVQTQMTTDRMAFENLRSLRLGDAAAQAGDALGVLQHTMTEVSKRGAAANMIEWARVSATVSGGTVQTPDQARAGLVRHDDVGGAAWVDVTVDGLCPRTTHDASLRYFDVNADHRADFVALCGLRPRPMDRFGHKALAGLVARINKANVTPNLFANQYLKMDFLNDAEMGAVDIKPARRGNSEVTGIWRYDGRDLPVDIVYLDREFYVSLKLDDSRNAERVNFFIPEAQAPALVSLFKSDSAPVVAAH